MFPLVLIFPPTYWPWSLLVFAGVGGVAAFALPTRAPKALVAALGMAVLMTATTLGINVARANLRFDVAYLPWWTILVLAPIFSGALAVVFLRTRFAGPLAAVFAAFAFAATAAVGAGAALALAPPEVAGLPACDRNVSCSRDQCALMAERRRLLAIEHVTASERSRVSCAYTAWFGLPIGRAEIGAGGGHWIDGWWPELVARLGR